MSCLSWAACGTHCLGFTGTSTADIAHAPVQHLMFRVHESSGAFMACPVVQSVAVGVCTSRRRGEGGGFAWYWVNTLLDYIAVRVCIGIRGGREDAGGWVVTLLKYVLRLSAQGFLCKGRTDTLI